MEDLGRHFGGSGAPFWSHFGGLGGFWLPNASWKASWAALGRFSEPRWLQLGAQEGPKLEPKRCKNWWENRLKIRWLWKSIFEGILMDFGKDFGTKIDAEIDVIFERRFFEKTSFFLWEKYTFLTSTGSKLGATTDQKSIKIWSPRWGASWHRFLMHFGRFWEASWEGKSSRNRLRIDPKKHRKNYIKKKGVLDGS